MTAPSAQPAEAALRLARDRLACGDAGAARAFAQQAVAAAPRWPDAHMVLGHACRARGDLDAAEAAFRSAVALVKHPDLLAALGSVQDQMGKAGEAERSFHRALALDRRNVAAAVGLSELLMRLGRPREALQATTPLASAGSAGHAVLAAHALALRALDRRDEALAVYRRAVAASPDSGVAEHNLAGLLADLGQAQAAEAAARRALAKGLDAPETWLVLARAQVGLAQFDAAETALAQALRRRPAYLDAHRDLAQLIWMRTADLTLAGARLDEALARTSPPSIDLFVLKSSLLTSAGETEAAFEFMDRAVRIAPNAVALRIAAAQACAAAGRAQGQLDHAMAAFRLAPEASLTALCAAYLGVGRAEEAEALAAEGLTRRPHDQVLLCYRTTAWRMRGDPRCEAMTDYSRLVRSWTLDAPPGWPNLDAYLADLTAELSALHAFRTHPLEQSVRHGSQVSNLHASDNPVIAAFFHAIDGPIRRHLAELPKGAGSVGERNTGRYGFDGAWSVSLRADGRHASHIHPSGWLSSACYISLPPDLDASSRAGWLQFGEPGIPTDPVLAPEHFVAPEPGMLVLFPSYLWHGTVPFSGDRARLTMAFDLVPKPR